MRICLYGSSSPDLEQKYYDKAFELGVQMGKRGHGMVFGGGEQGLMGACVRGLESAGGKAIGVAPRFFDLPGILHQECEEFIFTDTMHERKQIMEGIADAFVIVPGGVGTYEEFFEAFTLKQLGQMNKPIGLLNTDGYFDPLRNLLIRAADNNFMKRECLRLCGFFDESEELLEYIETVHDEPMHVKDLKRVK